MSIFKALAPGDISIIPFPAYYKFSYTYESGSTSNPDGIDVSYASLFLTASGDTRYPNVSNELYDSIVQSFYSPIPYATYGTDSDSYIPSASTYVVSIGQYLFGERVLPGSFSLRLNNTQSYDDGVGNLIVSSSNTGSIIGRIFYDKGIAVVKPTSSLGGSVLTKDGLYFPYGSSVDINFSSSVVFYENVFKIKVMPTDFLYPITNPTINNKLVSGSVPNQTAVEALSSGSLSAYVTTIGLYNDSNELLLVAKTSVPVQRTSDVPQTFIVKFDV